jgi:hypothetical protein
MDKDILAAWKQALEANEVSGYKYYEGSMSLKEWVVGKPNEVLEAGEDPAGYWLLDPFGVLCELYKQSHPAEWVFDPEMNNFQFVIPGCDDTRLIGYYAPDPVLAWLGFDREKFEDNVIAWADWQAHSFKYISEMLDYCEDV